MKYKLWLELRQTYEELKDVIIGVLPDELKGNEGDEEQLLQTKTNEFGSEIINNIKNLGVISDIKNNNPEQWSNLVKSIDSGISIKDLISQLSGIQSPMQI